MRVSSIIVLLCIFQSALPRRERLYLSVFHQSEFQFQSTLPQRERPNLFVFPFRGTDFNPRSRKGSDVCYLTMLKHHPYFNPRSRKGSDCVGVCDSDYRGISIHAPTKGATILRSWILPSFHISIHAPTKGATTFIATCYILIKNFNPRSHEGSDLTF